MREGWGTRIPFAVKIESLPIRCAGPFRVVVPIGSKWAAISLCAPLSCALSQPRFKAWPASLSISHTAAGPIWESSCWIARIFRVSLNSPVRVLVCRSGRSPLAPMKVVRPMDPSLAKSFLFHLLAGSLVRSKPIFWPGRSTTFAACATFGRSCWTGRRPRSRARMVWNTRG
jgi:hypothetical protein